MSTFQTGITCGLSMYVKDSAIHVGNLHVSDGPTGSWTYDPDLNGPYKAPHLLGLPGSGTTEWQNNILRLSMPVGGKLFGTLHLFSFLGSKSIGEKYIFQNADGEFDAKFYQYSNVPQNGRALASAGQSSHTALSGFIIKV